MASSTLWRVRNLANNGGQTGLDEVEMASSPGGTNLCTGGTPNASGTYGGFYGPDKAFNGTYTNSGGEWFTSQGTDSWISYEFAAPQEIVEIRLAPGQGDMNGTPRIMAFEYYNGTDWITDWYGIHGCAGRPSWNVGELVTFTKPGDLSAGARYWAFGGRIGASGNVDRVIREVEMRGTVGGPDLTTNDTSKPFGHTDHGNYRYYHCFDNDTGTLWYSDPTGKDSVIGYDFDTPVNLAEIWVKGDPAAGNLNRAPGTGRILRSSDGRSYQLAATYEKVYADYDNPDNATVLSIGEGGGDETIRRRMIIVT